LRQVQTRCNAWRRDIQGLFVHARKAVLGEANFFTFVFFALS